MQRLFICFWQPTDHLHELVNFVEKMSDILGTEIAVSVRKVCFNGSCIVAQTAKAAYEAALSRSFKSRQPAAWVPCGVKESLLYLREFITDLPDSHGPVNKVIEIRHNYVPSTQREHYRASKRIALKSSAPNGCPKFRRKRLPLRHALGSVREKYRSRANYKVCSLKPFINVCYVC
jgi:hypothetical protein